MLNMGNGPERQVLGAGGLVGPGTCANLRNFPIPATSSTTCILQIAVEEAIKHEDYLASSSDWHTPNDIALLRLARPVETGPNIIPVCLPLDPEASKPADAGHATVCGYGRTSPNKRDRGDTFVSRN